MRLIKALLILAILGFAGLVGYAYFGDMTPPAGDMSTPFTPGGGNGD